VFSNASTTSRGVAVVVEGKLIEPSAVFGSLLDLVPVMKADGIGRPWT
jgi:hypothetical protein